MGVLRQTWLLDSTTPELPILLDLLPHKQCSGCGYGRAVASNRWLWLWLWLW